MDLDAIPLVDHRAHGILCGSRDALTALLERWEKLLEQAQA